MRSWFALAALAVVGCSYGPDVAGRSPDPPEGVDFVALVTLDQEGGLARATGLFPRTPEHPYAAPIAARADGVRERLVGFTSEQLGACFEVADVPLEDDELTVATSPLARYPAPAWAAEGEWNQDRIEFEETTDDTAYVRRAIGGQMSACDAYDFDVVRHTTTSSRGVRFTLQPPNEPPLVFFSDGEIYQLDIDAMDVTPFASSTVAYVGGHVDDEGIPWIFRRDGRLDTLGTDGTITPVHTDGPWRRNSRVFAGGVGQADDVELYVVTSSATVLRYKTGVWTELFQAGVIPTIGRVLSADVHYARDEGVAYIGMDSMSLVYRVEGDVIHTAPVGEGPLGPPIGFVDSKRYGFMATTKSGGLVRQVAPDAWTIVLPAEEGRRSPYIFDFDYGIVHGGAAGFFRYYVEGLETCRLERAGEGEPQAVMRVGDSILVFERGGTSGDRRLEIVEIRVDALPLGCGVVVD